MESIGYPDGFGKLCHHHGSQASGFCTQATLPERHGLEAVFHRQLDFANGEIALRTNQDGDVLVKGSRQSEFRKQVLALETHIVGEGRGVVAMCDELTAFTG